MGLGFGGEARLGGQARVGQGVATGGLQRAAALPCAWHPHPSTLLLNPTHRPPPQRCAQLIAHDKEVYDIAWGGLGVFASVSADGSVRVFDLR